MDMLLTRDLSPLLEHEFVTQWDCYGDPIDQSTLTDRSLKIYRQNLPSVEWRAYALPQALALPLRGVPSHGA